MKERGWIGPIVERVVAQVWDSHAAPLRTEIVRRVMEEIAAQSAIAQANIAEPGTGAAAADCPAELARAVAEIQMGGSQREILCALLDTCARYAARVALFVVKGSHATGWQARGFANNQAVKDFVLDEIAPAIAHAIAGRVVASAPAADLDPRFLHQLGTPASGEGHILPLILKDRVAALLYADSGTEAPGPLDPGSLELLVLATRAWLEVIALRKHAHQHSLAANLPSDSQGVPALPTEPAFDDSSAARHVPGQTMAAAASAPAVEAAAMAVESQNAPVEVPGTVPSAVAEPEPALAEPLPLAPAETEAAPGTPPVSSISPEHREVHRKAQRFARLLVDEIELYNRAQVAEGRKNKDLYDRLQDAIEKSRVTYHERYGNTVAGPGNYFQREIIRSLAEDDPSIMGANFRQ